MGPVQTISYFARRVIQFEQKFARRDSDALQETASLFRSASDGLDALLDALDAGSSLDSPCYALQLLLPSLEGELQAEVPPPESEKLAQMLREALNPERIHKQFSEAANARALQEELEKAAILVRALADGLHVDSPAG